MTIARIEFKLEYIRFHLFRVAVPAQLDMGDRDEVMCRFMSPKPTSDVRCKCVDENDNEDRAGDGSTSSS